MHDKGQEPVSGLGFGVDPHQYEVVVHIRAEADVAMARQLAKSYAVDAGFTLADVTKVATAVSELARNIYRYAREGTICIRRVTSPATSPGLEIVAVDRGPGIPEVERVLAGGFSTYERSLGIGIAGVRRLMDQFELHTEVGVGTRVRAVKFMRRF